MQFQDVVHQRRMVRRYTPEPVDPAVLTRLLENATRAPSAGFSQGWAFLVLDTADDLARFWDATTPPERAGRPDAWLRGMRTAPVVIVPLACEDAYRRRYAEPDKGRRPGQQGELPWSVPYWHVDAGMAALLILLGAVDAGLGACFFGVPAARVGELRARFGIPDDHEPVGAVTVGHPDPGPSPAGSPARRGRRPLEEVVHRGRW
ncbi:nitroreductase family protein [Georgenia deserti]|uniref:Nitroreductase family protein n=1 Tax=Georgenia deserti TaxID=2093781 RepID=A0ABW4L2F3_9MICO